MENDESIKPPYKFSKKILVKMSIVSLILTIFVFPISDGYDIFKMLAYDIGFAIGLVLFPLIFVSFCNLIRKLFKSKLEKEDFWRLYFISWIIFACLSIFGHVFL